MTNKITCVQIPHKLWTGYLIENFVLGKDISHMGFTINIKSWHIGAVSEEGVYLIKNN